VCDDGLAARIAGRLIDSFNHQAGIFPHWPVGACASFLRAHVACFADLVYPTQALALYHRHSGDEQAGAAARRCAQAMAANQGDHGQWWWHYDRRTGDVIERLASEGCKHVLIAPIGFVCEHVEVLYDVDIVFKGQAASLGIQLERIEMLNTAPQMINGLADLVIDVVKEKKWL